MLTTTYMSQGGLFGGIRLYNRQVGGELLSKDRSTASDRPGETGKFAESFLSIFFDGLLEGGDVAKGEQKQHHHIFLVPDGCNLQKKP